MTALTLPILRMIRVDTVGDRVAIVVVDQHRGTETTCLEMSAVDADLLAGHLVGAVTEIGNRARAAA